MKKILVEQLDLSTIFKDQINGAASGQFIDSAIDEELDGKM